MSLKKIAPAAIALAVAFAPFAASAQQAQEEPVLTPKQTEAVRKIVRDYIMQNPDIIADAIEALREQQRVKAEEEAKKALLERRQEIYNDPESPIVGNVEGDVTIVEFFDYRCGYCKSVHDTLLDVVKADGKVKVIYKEYPILGPDSVVAARAALASRKQNKYEQFHNAMMKLKGPVNEASILKTAGEVGMDVEQLKKDMNDPVIQHILAQNVGLARALDINGTPAFIIGERMIPGALDAGTFKSLIEQTRKTASKG